MRIIGPPRIKALERIEVSLGISFTPYMIKSNGRRYMNKSNIFKIEFSGCI